MVLQLRWGKLPKNTRKERRIAWYTSSSWKGYEKNDFWYWFCSSVEDISLLVVVGKVGSLPRANSKMNHSKWNDTSTPGKGSLTLLCCWDINVETWYIGSSISETRHAHLHSLPHGSISLKGRQSPNVSSKSKNHPVEKNLSIEELKFSESALSNVTMAILMAILKHSYRRRWRIGCLFDQLMLIPCLDSDDFARRRFVVTFAAPRDCDRSFCFAAFASNVLLLSSSPAPVPWTNLW